MRLSPGYTFVPYSNGISGYLYRNSDGARLLTVSINDADWALTPVELELSKAWNGVARLVPRAPEEALERELSDVIQNL